VKTRNIISYEVLMPNHRCSRFVQKIAAPKSMDAVTAITPTRLIHPVNQPQVREPSFDAQKYMEPAVGIDEATSASPNPTKVTMTPTRSQPHVTVTGPPCEKARKYEVSPPARMDMIVKEMAKLENEPIPRAKTWR